MPEMTGQRHWKRPDQLQVHKEPGWGYKYIRKEDVERRLAEGWEVCKKSEKVLNETGRTDSSQHYRGMILMRMPQHMVDERNKFYRDKHLKRVRAVAGASSLRDKADDINKGVGGDLTGALGKGLVLKEGVRTHDGLVHSHTTTIPPGPVDPEDAAALPSKEVPSLPEEETPKSKTKKGGK